MAIDGTRRSRLFASACVGMFVFGIVLALLGTLFGLPEMQARLQIGLGQQGNLFLLLYFGILLSNIAAGPAIDRFGHRPVLLVSSLLVTMALVGFSIAHSFAVAAVATTLLGVGGGGLNTGTTALTSDLYGEQRGSMLSFLGVFFGVGALCIPLLAAALAAHFTVVQLLLFAAGLAAMCLVGYAVLGFPPIQRGGSVSIFETVRVGRYPGVLLFGFVLFFQSGIEGAVAGWTSSYLSSRGADSNTATWVLAGFWAGMMAGRGLGGIWLRQFAKGQVVLWSGRGAFVGSVVLLAASSIPVLAACAVFLGLCFASIFPGTLGMAGDRYQQSAGSVYALLFAIAVLGGMSLPWAVGQIGETLGLRAGLFVPIAGSAMVCVLVSVLLRRDAKASARMQVHGTPLP